MSTATTEPAPTPAPPAERRAPRGVLAATALIATIGTVAALLGIVLLLRPVTTPTQDCGTSLGFLLDGRVNEFVSETDPPAGVTVAEAKANNAEPCRTRVAERAKPVAVLLGGGLVAAVIAASVELVVRNIGWWKRSRARRSAPPTDTGLPAPPDPAAP